MKKFYIKQEIFSLSGKFAVKDSQGNDVYFVEGSFMQIPKIFTIRDTEKHIIALITKKTFSLLPAFSVDVNGHEVLKIKKELSFLKARYSIDM